MMLMFGDSYGTLAPVEGFDQIWGNGRFDMRLFDDTHMVDPWGWGGGSSSIAQAPLPGVTTVVASFMIPQNSQSLTVTAWWPEPNLNATYADDSFIKMYVRRTGWSPGSPGMACGASTSRVDDLYDTKKRYIWEQPTTDRNCQFQIEFEGVAVPGNNQRRTVYWSYYYQGGLPPTP